MRLRLIAALACFLSILLSDAPAWARSPRAKRHAQETAAGPPFPWTAVAETVGPILGVWLGAVFLSWTFSREKKDSFLVAGEIVSLPVAWFAATTRLFEKKKPETKAGPPEKKRLDEYENPALDVAAPIAELQQMTTSPPLPESDF